jgi:hypothetical protein
MGSSGSRRAHGLTHHHRRQLLYASSDPPARYSVGPESSTALMTAAAVATLTSGNEQRHAETAAVLAIAVGAVCVRMACAAWLLADGLWVCGHLRAAGLATCALVLTMCDDVSVLAALRAGAYG